MSITTIAHLSDTHLGYTGHGLQQTLPDPRRPGCQIGLREHDIQQGLVRAVDHIIERVRPVLVIHTGDLFETARPSPHTVDFAMSQLRRLSEVGIPLLVVEGNHSCPRDRAQGSVLRLLAHLPGVTVVCGEPATVQVADLVVHALPHRAVALGRVPDRGALVRGCPNLLAAHGVADGLDVLRTGRPARDLPVRACAGWYDYVALGHCHRFGQVPGTDRAFYAGSTAMVTGADFRPGHRFGFNVVTLDGVGGCPTVERELLETRAMQPYGLDDAEGLSPMEVLDFLARQAAAVPPAAACCQVVVERLDPLARRTLSHRQVEELFADAAILTVSLRAREQRWEAVRAGLLEGGDASTRFAQLVAQADGDAAFKADVLALGQELLERADQQIGAEDLTEADGNGASRVDEDAVEEALAAP